MGRGWSGCSIWGGGVRGDPSLALWSCGWADRRAQGPSESGSGCKRWRLGERAGPSRWSLRQACKRGVTGANRRGGGLGGRMRARPTPRLEQRRLACTHSTPAAVRQHPVCSVQTSASRFSEPHVHTCARLNSHLPAEGPASYSAVRWPSYNDVRTPSGAHTTATPWPRISIEQPSPTSPCAVCPRHARATCVEPTSRPSQPQRHTPNLLSATTAQAIPRRPPTAGHRQAAGGRRLLRFQPPAGLQ